MQLSGHSTNNSLNTDPIPNPSSIGSTRDTSESLGSNNVPAESSLSLSSNIPTPELFSGETDPVFRAWDKRTGIEIDQSQIVPAISITQSQISDGGTIVNTGDLATISINTSGTLEASNLSGNNTGDVDMLLYVPFVGGVSDLNMNSNDITNCTLIETDAITINDVPVNPTDGVNKDYVDGIVAGDISGLVPYTGATGDLDMGVHSITTTSITIDNAPVNGTDGVNKTYADAITTAQTLLVPYTGATGDVNLGVRNLSVANVTSTGIIKSTGGRRAVVIKTSGYTATTNDEVIVCNSAVDFAITLPVATGSGQMYYIKNINVNIVTVTPNGVDTIDAETSQSIRDGDCINLVDYAANKWAII